MDVWGADIGNAYLESSTTENLSIVGCPEFQKFNSHILVIIKHSMASKALVSRWAQRINDIMLDMDIHTL